MPLRDQARQDEGPRISGDREDVERGPSAPAAHSRVGLVSTGLDAFAARAASARLATRSLDLQYYTWHGDLTGRLLAREVLQAADRGIRVRMLLDDMYMLGPERGLTTLDRHPMVQIRHFNASRLRHWGWPGFLLEVLLGGWHLNRRMHNKVWIADGNLVVCGGRNIGDRYFDASEDFNFRDLDMVVQGKAAHQAVDLFETYWNSPLAQRVERLPHLRRRSRALKRLRAKYNAAAASPAARPFLEHAREAELHRPHTLMVEDVAIRIMADPPEKALGRAEGVILPRLTELLQSARREALLISPYFVPGEAGAAQLIRLVQSGVRVAVVTNSLAATDVVAVHGGYARYRERLIAAGVEIFELKPFGESKAGMFGSRGASLHTKAVVVDNGPVFVGSFNLDPRSANLNTEMGVLADHPALARLARWHHRRLTWPSRSWRVRLLGKRLVWDDGTPMSAGRPEPEASLSRRLLARFVRWLPVESQL